MLSNPLSTFPGAKISSGSEDVFPGGDAKISSGGLSNTLTVGVGCDWDFGPVGRTDSSFFLLLLGFLLSANKSSSNPPFCFDVGRGMALALNKSLSIVIPGIWGEDAPNRSLLSTSGIVLSKGLGKPGDLDPSSPGLAETESEEEDPPLE